MKIFQVNQVVVQRISTSPLVLAVHAIGLASTSGWSAPKLDNSGDSNPADAIFELSFEATKPSGVVLEVLTSISASAEIRPATMADAVIVSSRTNNIVVHTSDFVDSAAAAAVRGHATTLAIGEEILPHLPSLTTRPSMEEHWPSTMAFGEEGIPPITTSPLTDDPRPDWDPRIDRRFDPTVDPWGPYRNSFGRF